MWHVGLLYRIIDLLELLDQRDNYHTDTIINIHCFHGVETERLISIAITGKWLYINNNQNLCITPQGRNLLLEQESILQLRSQIFTLITILNPSWVATTAQGRQAFVQYAPQEVIQCFRESGLLDSFDDEVVRWWDQIATRFREARLIDNIKTGRKGERLSYDLEKKRTGKDPYWIALEFDGAGYDIKSQVGSDIEVPLLIEVKASTQSWTNATFFLSRHEWKVLSKETYAVFHLWSLATQPPEYAIIAVANVESHIPLDKGNGEWKIVECPFSVFESNSLLGTIPSV